MIRLVSPVALKLRWSVTPFSVRKGVCVQLCGISRRSVHARGGRSVLNLPLHPTKEVLQQAFFDFARTMHPDVAGDDAHDRFIRGKAEYEEALARLKKGYARSKASMYGDWHDVPTQQSSSEAQGSGGGGGGGPAWGTGSMRFDTEFDDSKLSPMQLKLKAHITENQFAEAVEIWEKSGSDLLVLLFLLEVCIRLEKLPSNLSYILEVLHRSERREKRKRAAGNSSVPEEEARLVKETGVMLFHGQKTQAYNQILRTVLCGGGSTSDLHMVLYAMWDAGTPKDTETFQRIDHANQWMRQDYSVDNS